MDLALHHVWQRIQPLREPPGGLQHHPQQRKLGRLPPVAPSAPHAAHESQPRPLALPVQLVLPPLARRAELPRVVRDDGVQHPRRGQALPAAASAALVSDQVPVQQPPHPVVLVDGPRHDGRGGGRGVGAARAPQEAPAKDTRERGKVQTEAEVGDGGAKVLRVGARPGNVREGKRGEDTSCGGDVCGLCFMLVEPSGFDFFFEGKRQVTVRTRWCTYVPAAEEDTFLPWYGTFDRVQHLSHAGQKLVRIVVNLQRLAKSIEKF